MSNRSAMPDAPTANPVAPLTTICLCINGSMPRRINGPTTDTECCKTASGFSSLEQILRPFLINRANYRVFIHDSTAAPHPEGFRFHSACGHVPE